MYKNARNLPMKYSYVVFHICANKAIHAPIFTYKHINT